MLTCGSPAAACADYAGFAVRQSAAGLVQTPGVRIDQAGAPATLVATYDIQPAADERQNRHPQERQPVGRGRPGGVGWQPRSTVAVHLLGDYTPVPKEDAASMVVRSNGIVVYRAHSAAVVSWTPRSSCPIRRWVSGSASTSRPAPHEAAGRCWWPIAFQIDPRSTDHHPGRSPTRGFSALPSEFDPTFAWSPSTAANSLLRRPGGRAIARLTSRQLTPRVVDLKTAVDASSGALIVARSSAIGQDLD